MNLWKWLQFVCTYAMGILPFAFEFKDHKYEDQDPAKRKRVTRWLFILLLIFALGTIPGMYQDFSKKEKSPNLIAFVNGVNLQKTNSVILRFTNDTQFLHLAVLNDGNLPADGLVAVLSTPAELNITATSAWIKGPGDVNTNDLSIIPHNNFYLDDNSILSTKSLMPYVPFVILPFTNHDNVEATATVRLSTRGFSDTVYNFKLLITNTVPVGRK